MVGQQRGLTVVATLLEQLFLPLLLRLKMMVKELPTGLKSTNLCYKLIDKELIYCYNMYLEIEELSNE